MQFYIFFKLEQNTMYSIHLVERQLCKCGHSITITRWNVVKLENYSQNSVDKLDQIRYCVVR